jgi:hypothetical protein
VGVGFLRGVWLVPCVDAPARASTQAPPDVRASVSRPSGRAWPDLRKWQHPATYITRSGEADSVRKRPVWRV